MPVVHGVNLSPFVRKVRVALTEKGIAYELKPVLPASDEFEPMNPLKKIPVYEEDGFAVPGSSVIIAYLERRQPNPPLHPRDDRQFAQALFLEEYADTKLTDATLPFVVENVIKPKLLGGAPDLAALDTARAAQGPVFDYLESRLGTHTWAGIIGGRFSVADIAIGCPFVSLQQGGGVLDAARWPKLARYIRVLHSRPSFKGLIEEEAASLRG
ncbi:MAG: glutathione S-transferase family protein [Deltaproteobacteria bacterium]|nr:glutathione S-transferase family protein [Deltaproteobacteria bacterium]MBW2415577.1 glutathione S-transferase family protein [Deltaproteobacteria bacterium]